MADESTSYSDLISRRRFVELTGVTGAAALAGCDGDGDGTATPGSTDDSQNTDDGTATDAEQFHADVTHLGSSTAQDMSVVQFNPWNSSDGPAISDRLLFEKLAQYSFADGEFKPAALKDWQLDGDTFTMTLRDGLKWSNGDDVTADDIVRQFRIAKYDQDPVWNWAGGIEATDDKTAEITIDGEVNDIVVESDLFAQRMLKADEETYGEYLSQLESSDSDEGLGDLGSFADTEPVTNGPFAYAGANEQELKTTHVSQVDGADHPDAGKINFGKYNFQTAGGNQQAAAALNSLSVDSNFSLSVPARTVAGFPDAVEVVNWPNVWGFGITPNHEHRHAGDRPVRQAIAFAVNREAAVNNSLPRAKRAPDLAVGITDVNDAQETYLGDAHGDFESYGKAETMTDKVTEVMEGGGYSKVDGTWQDSDGNTVSLPVTCPSGWGDWVAQAETVVDNLNAVGFQSEFVGMTGFAQSGNVLKKGDFVLASGPWLHGGPLSHPYFSFQHTFVDPQVVTQEVRAAYPTWSEEWGGKGNDTEITVPARSGDGEMSIKPAQAVQEMSQTSDQERIQELTLDLAWVSNVDLPIIPVADKIYQSWLTSDDWDVPLPPNEDPDATLAYPQTWLPRKGKMNYKA